MMGPVGSTGPDRAVPRGAEVRFRGPNSGKTPGKTHFGGQGSDSGPDGRAPLGKPRPWTHHWTTEPTDPKKRGFPVHLRPQIAFSGGPGPCSQVSRSKKRTGFGPPRSWESEYNNFGCIGRDPGHFCCMSHPSWCSSNPWSAPGEKTHKLILDQHMGTSRQE